MFVSGHVTVGKIRVTCVATKLRDKLQEKLTSVTAPLKLESSEAYLVK